jgi:hypothetical protein
MVKNGLMDISVRVMLTNILVMSPTAIPTTPEMAILTFSGEVSSYPVW